MRAAAGWRDSSSASAAAVALRALLIATACGLVFALLNLPDGGRAGTPAPDGQSDEIAAEEDERISKSPPDTKEKIWMMQDQLIMAKAYLHFASPQGSAHLVRELKLRIKEIERAISHSSGGSRVAGSALQKMKAMELTLSKAQRAYPRCSQMTSKLRAMTYNSEELVRAHQSESSFLEEVAVRTLPKGHHCLAMRLTTEYFSLDPKEREFPKVDSKQMDGYHHYAIFSDNVLASAVVVNSTIATSKGKRQRLWKAGSLPLGQLVFYNQTLPLDRRWHVLGLGHDSSIGRYDLESASVIHYSGKLKPWLEISIPKYRDYWNSPGRSSPSDTRGETSSSSPLFRFSSARRFHLRRPRHHAGTPLPPRTFVSHRSWILGEAVENTRCRTPAKLAP
nr:unnamed protein product [Digitaria exilis]